MTKPSGTAFAGSPWPEPMPFGSGFVSGVLSAILGMYIWAGAVLCLHFPRYLTARATPVGGLDSPEATPCGLNSPSFRRPWPFDLLVAA
ncbi:MAG: hypothetical protein ABIS06_09900 [Vicinamibacterales bacterium]